MDNLIKRLIREYFEDYNDFDSFNIGSISDKDLDNLAYDTVKQIKVDNKTKKLLQNINWTEIKVGNKSNDLLRVILPYGKFSSGIYVMISKDSDNLNHMHIKLADDLQGLGLGYKIHKAVLNYVGNLYSPIADRKNKLITNIYNSLSNDQDIECFKNKAGSDLCFMKNKVNKPLLIKFSKLR